MPVARSAAVVSSLALLLALPCFARAAAPPSVEAFTAFPKFDSLAISPDGKRLAVTQREGDKRQLMIVAFPSMKGDRTLSFPGDVEIDDIRWAGDDVMLIQPARLFGSKAVKLPTGEIIRVDTDTGKTKSLVAFGGQILTTRTGSDRQVLIQTAGFGPTPATAQLLNLQSGLQTKVATAPVQGGRFVLGSEHRAALAVGINAAGKTEVHQNAGKGDWALKVTSGGESGTFTPVGWTGNGDEYYALDNRDAPTSGVVVWDATANTQRALYRNPQVDLGAAAFDNSGRAWLFAGTDHYPVYWYPDPEFPLARMHAKLVQQLPHQVVEVMNQTDDNSVAVVRISAGQRPPVFLVVDVATAKPLQLMATYPDLKSENLAPVDAIEFNAKDGTKIRGYLTTPKGADGKPGRNLPTVVLVHDGPNGIASDYGYDFERQLLASRGYAVLQVNYRGSGGRGRVFERAGYGKWGREMQDDVSDGVRWAIKDGVTDATRVCIVGEYYGGYSALAGAARDPGLFKCAVGIAGTYDLPLMIEKATIPNAPGVASFLKETVGDDPAELRASSPVYNAKAIQAKVLLVSVKNDFRAPSEHTERMRKALADAGNAPELFEPRVEAGGRVEPAQRVDSYNRILAFLEKHIGR